MENRQPTMQEIIQKKIDEAKKNNTLKDKKAPQIQTINAESLKADSNAGF